MALAIHNSLSGKKEPFEPLRSGEVRMYVCGPTVYDEPHIGHLRSAYVFEVMRRQLEFLGYKVKFVRNVTDVDDKIIKKAVDSKKTVDQVSKENYDLYAEDLKRLGVRPPDEEPRATGYIRQMQEMIRSLIDKGFAYAADGDVYYDVEKFRDYGKLSGQKKDAMLEGVRIEPEEKKKNPLDFALWKKAKEGEPFWDSPWGKGRPGWHIECSAMSKECLGETFDIHGGGRDLIFPHHENEVAQSEAANGKPFARFWVHHGLVTVEGQKMSKSLKNYVTLKEIASGSPEGMEELKLLFLGTHYSAPLDYSADKMKMEKAVRERFMNFLSDAKEAPAGGNDPELLRFSTQFDAAMSDDFNTPQAFTVIHETINHARKSGSLSEAGGRIRAWMERLGLLSDAVDSPLEKEVFDLVRERDEAKKRKDYKRSDEIRDILLKKHRVQIKDTKDGTRAVRM